MLVAVAVLLPVGYWGARHLAWPAVKAWRVERMNTEARAFLTEGDHANALLSARKVLQTSKENLEAWRIAAAATRARGTVDVVFYQQNVARLEPTKSNLLEVIRLALKFDGRGAAEAIETAAGKANDDPEFHSLASQYYRRMGRMVAAKYHLIALTQLNPSDREAQLQLAEIELAEDPARKDLALRARVRALADDPNLRVRALSLLLRESIKAKLSVEVGQLIGRLQAVPDLTIQDRLLLIEGTAQLDRPSLPLLEKLQAEIVEKPQEVVRVMEFLSRTGQHREATAWYARLPEDTKKDENVRRMVADALLVLQNWPALEAHLKVGTWNNQEFLRQGFLAYAHRAQGRSGEFNEAWKTAVVAVGNDRYKIGELMRRTEVWKWTEERYDVVWKLFSVMPTHASVQQALIAWEKRHGRTANLNKIFARIAEVDSGDVLARNNLAYTSLLLDSNIARATLIANQLAAEKPKDAFIATTQAFAFFKQGNAAEALSRLESLSAAELSLPDRTLLRAVILARLGQSERAIEMIKGVNLKLVLPEERKLAENALAEIARNARTKEDQTRLGAMKPLPVGEGSGWLVLVSPEARASATLEMQLTDPLYGSRDWTALQTALRGVDWKTNNYLRLALLAYVGKAQGNLLASRDSWRQALLATERNVARAENLKALADHWEWPAERLDAVNIVFEKNPTDRALLQELLKHYREERRTRDLSRLLTQYVSRTADTTDEAVASAYYSLLLDENTTRAHPLAKRTFDQNPQDPTRRLVHVFSLYKQKRFSEANALLIDLKGAAESQLVPSPLLRAAVDAELGLTSESRSHLALFNAEAALPEEAALAERISAQLSRQAGAQTKSP